MVQPVLAGERIRATQFNELRQLALGPQCPSNSIPFTGSDAGLMLNGGCPPITYRSATHPNQLLTLTYGCGQLPLSSFDGYDEDPSKNEFYGMWMQMAGAYASNYGLFYHQQWFEAQFTPFIIDDTANEFKLISLFSKEVTDAQAKGRIFQKWPLCKAHESASLGVFQSVPLSVTPSEEYNPCDGALIFVFGNWDKLRLRPNSGGGWNVPWVFEGHPELFDTLKQALPISQSLKEKLGKLRFVGSFPLFYGLSCEASLSDYTALTANWEPTTINLGQQHLETAPDGSEGNEDVTTYGLSACCLSSLQYTPAAAFGVKTSFGVPTFAYSLFNFDRLSSDHINESEPLSNYDMLVRHKGRRANFIDTALSDECSAVLEYIPMTTWQTDSEVTQLSSIGKNNDDETSCLEIYRFHDFNYKHNYDVYSPEGGIDFIVRDSRNDPTAKVQYITLSSMNSNWLLQGDADDPGQQQSSIETYFIHNDRYAQLYEFDNPNHSRTLNVRLSYDGLPKYISSNGIGTTPDPKLQFITRDASNNGLWVSYDNVTITAPKISAGDIENLENFVDSHVSADIQIIISSDPTLTGEFQALKEKDAEISAQLSTFWKLGGDTLSCYGKSLGDSSQRTVLDMDGRKIQDQGGGTVLTWGTAARTMYRGSGTMGLYISNTEGKLYHSSGDWTIDFQNCELKGPNGTQKLDWKNRELGGNWLVSGNLSVDGDMDIDQGQVLKIGNETLTEQNLHDLLQLLTTAPNAIHGI